MKIIGRRTRCWPDCLSKGELVRLVFVATSWGRGMEVEVTCEVSGKGQQSHEIYSSLGIYVVNKPVWVESKVCIHPKYFALVRSQQGELNELP